MATFVNMTPHPINIVVDDDEIEIAPSDNLIRLKENWNQICVVDGVPLTHCSYSSEIELPPMEDNTYYIVSAMVANAFPERTDFLIPAQTIRDENGRITGCTSLAVVNYSWVVE